MYCVYSIVTSKHKKMDTGDLSEEAYNAIMIEAERFNHDLTLQFGLLSYHCADEDDFIEKSIALINEIKKYDEIAIDDMFFGNPPRKEEFHKTLERILVNIRELKKIPIDKRNYD
ncbi:MAG: hypothetical protein KAU83_07495 [Bacteroidales bacterium]|nr:hypothetical protein [Bacteroidales bacterium]